MKENEIGTIIVDTALQLHRGMGPGLLETVYEFVLAKREHRGKNENNATERLCDLCAL